MRTPVVFRVTRWALFVMAVLEGIAMLLYPGGTHLDPTARGYSFFHNSMSDLGSTVAWNGVLHGRFSLLAVGSFPVATALLALATARNPVLRRRVPVGWLVLTCVVVAWASMMLTTRPTTGAALFVPVTLQKLAAIVLFGTLVMQSYEAERAAAAAATAA